jgi:hypothetical protein
VSSAVINVNIRLVFGMLISFEMSLRGGDCLKVQYFHDSRLLLSCGVSTVISGGWHHGEAERVVV